MSIKKNSKQIPCWNWEARVINDKLKDASLVNLIMLLLAVTNLSFILFVLFFQTMQMHKQF